jgi:peptide methionine sulfoxide reductase msrA/msrB
MQIKRLLLFSIFAVIFSACNAQVKNKTMAKDQTQELDMSKYKTAVYASGCFWGTEFYLQKTEGVISTTVGYTGGHVDNPTYEQVCGKKTGHYEAVEVVYDPAVISYEQLTKIFFETHNPEQANGQGPDIGPQYRSAIFVTDDAEKATANKLIAILEAKGYKIATVVLPAAKFWPAELYHQDYYDNKGGTPYCHAYTKRF